MRVLTQFSNKNICHLTHRSFSLVDKYKIIESGCDLSDERVKMIVEAVVDSQLEDGGWRPFWVDKSAPVYTMLTLKLLGSLGALKVGDLRAHVLSIYGK